MRKRPVQISIVIGVIIVAALAFLLMNSNSDNSSDRAMDTSTSMQVAKEQPNDQAPAAATPNQATGVYKDYSPEAVANASGTTLLFFHAPWCSQCRALDSDIKDRGVPENVTVLKVDYDSNQQLRQKYGVTIQTTVVKVDSQGNQIAKYVAYDSPTLQSVLDNLR